MYRCFLDKKENWQLFVQLLVNVLLGKCNLYVWIAINPLLLNCRHSASCTHVSAVLHVLNGLKQPTLQPQLLDMHVEEAEIPSTSLLCNWNVPNGTKNSKLRVSEAPFDKHDYAKPQKRKIPKIEDFDPRPSQFRGLAKDNLPKLLSDIDGNQLCISLLLDSKYATEAATTL